MAAPSAPPSPGTGEGHVGGAKQNSFIQRRAAAEFPAGGGASRTLLSSGGLPLISPRGAAQVELFYP